MIPPNAVLRPDRHITGGDPHVWSDWSPNIEQRKESALSPPLATPMRSFLRLDLYFSCDLLHDGCPQIDFDFR
jgi:hypothetical protein